MLGFLFPSLTQQNVLIHGCSADEILQQRFKANNKATENFGTSYNIGLLSCLCCAEAKDFSSSLRVQTKFEAHSASYPVGTGNSLAGVKRDREVTINSHPHLVPILAPAWR